MGSETRKGEHEYLERRALWKLDLTVIPILACFYFLSFLDRSNLGNARIAGLQTQLRLSDHQYSIALTVTFIPYILAEVPANLLLKKMGAHYFLPASVTIWGLVATMQGFVRSYQGLIAARFFLGLAEGGLYPAMVLYLSGCYLRRELQLRIALFFSTASLSGAFSGLLAYEIIKLDGKGGQPGWAWIFIIEGLFTIVFGVISFFIFPASIEANAALNSSEKSFLKARLVNESSMADWASGRSAMVEFLAALRSPHVVLNCISVFMSGTLTYSLAYFQPSIIRSLGYSASRSQLMSVPPYAVAFVVVLLTAYYSDKHLGRAVVSCVCSLVGMIGFILFYVADPAQTSLKYGSLFISISGANALAPALSAWQSNNSQTHYRQASAIALGSVAANCGGILSTWIFPESEKPRYRTGTTVNISFCVGIVLLVMANFIWLREANRRKVCDRKEMIRDYPGHDDCVDSEKGSQLEIRQKAWAVLGDRHPDFKYTL